MRRLLPWHSSDDDEDDFEPYECRLYAPYERVTETFHLLNGASTTITHDAGVVSQSRASIDTDGLYTVASGALPEKSNRSSIRVNVTKVGEIARETVPVIERDDVEEMVAVVEARHYSESWWEFLSDIEFIPLEEFEQRTADERTEITVR